MCALEAGWNPVEVCDLCKGQEFEPAYTRAVDGRKLDRCKECGLVFLNPNPGPEAIARWYQADYFTSTGAMGMGASYLENAEAGIRHGTEAFFQFSRRMNLKGLRLLEIGCGGGAFIVQCRNAGAKVCGLEISDFAAARLRERYQLDVRVGVAETAPFEQNSFDCVVFTDVIEHVPSPNAFMLALHRLLTPTGHVFGLLPNLDCVAYYGPTWAGLKQHAEHIFYFKGETLSRLLRQSGFKSLDLWTYGEPYEPSKCEKFVHSREPIIWKEWLRGQPGMMPTIRFVRRISQHLNSAFRERQARYRLGLGHDRYFLAQRI